MARPPRPAGPCEGETVRGRGRILTTLCKEDGLSQKTLSDRLGIRPQSLSEAIVKLIDEGFVKRLPSDSDKRELLIFITDEGRKRGEEIRTRREIFANSFFSSLSDDEMDSLFVIMKKLEKNVKEEII
jgi:DNA-binding MarR family transcriptional regulator